MKYFRVKLEPINKEIVVSGSKLHRYYNRICTKESMKKLGFNLTDDEFRDFKTMETVEIY